MALGFCCLHYLVASHCMIHFVLCVRRSVLKIYSRYNGPQRHAETVVFMWHMLDYEPQQQWFTRQCYHPHRLVNKTNRHTGDSPEVHEDHKGMSVGMWLWRVS